MIFSGDLEQSDFARGYVDANVVTSQSNGDGPYNVAQADAISNAGNTDDPDLETVSIKSDNKLYSDGTKEANSFDEVRTSAGSIQKDTVEVID